MPHRRRVLSIVLLLVLLGAGRSIWVANREPDPVLRTVTVSAMPGQVVVDAATDRAFVNNYQDQSVSVLDGRTGAMLHSAALTGAIPSGVALDARTDRVFAVSAGANAASTIQAGSGRVLRTVTVGPVPVNVAVDTQTGRVFIPSSGGATVTVLDARSGAVLRTVAVAPHPAAAVVDECTGRVFVVHGRGTTKGHASSFLPTFQQVGPVGVTMLDARSGAVLRTLTVGGDTADDKVGWAPISTIAVDEQRGHVFVINRYDPGSGDGSVSVLDATSGALLHTITVGRHPISLAVDEATERLFVVNTNAGCVRLSGLWDSALSLLHPLFRLFPAPPPSGCNLPGTVSVIDTAHL